jgi:D-alanyl-D-alanine carboxypeptidase
MRVIDPKQRERLRKQKSKPSRRPIVLLVLLIVIGAGIFAKIQFSNSPETGSATDSQSQQAEKSEQLPAPKAKTGKLKTFTAEEFRDLYHKFAYPNTAPISESTPVTGNESADKRIKQLAAQRGYKIRSAPVTNAFVNVGGGHKLQQKAVQPWLDLEAAAKKEGVSLGLTSAYRSADEQKKIFLQRLYVTGATNAGIAAGRNDAQVTQVLAMTAPPGYSRHHTGYTVDISCENQPGGAFESTVCFRWLSNNNYEKAKTHGWIPGYPKGAPMQGPEPEAWEYVWVGKDALIE